MVERYRGISFRPSFKQLRWFYFLFSTQTQKATYFHRFKTS
uniref:G-protein coupled receptors family 1 profile domain-containing protein n=1 Tax=Parascaris univalens TaxID=6257 RepID=A0A915AHW7_PARUN